LHEENKIVTGKKFKFSSTVTYNDETMLLPDWAYRLDTTRSNLLARIRKAETGEITWDIAMLDREGRSKHAVKLRQDKMVETQVKRKVNRDSKKVNKEKSIDITASFFRMPLILGDT